jgi:hypothetical protein
MTDALALLLQKLTPNRDEATTMIATLAKGIDMPETDSGAPTGDEVEEIIVDSFDLLTAESAELSKLRESTRAAFTAYALLGRAGDHDVDGAMIDHLAVTIFELATNFLSAAPLYELADGRGDELKDSIEPSIYDGNARIPGCWIQV